MQPQMSTVNNSGDKPWHPRKNQLFFLLSGFFITNALLAEFIGVKIFSLEKSVGFSPLDLNFFGLQHASLNLTAGVLLWPIVFVLTDLINEYYGIRAVRRFSWFAVTLIIYAFLLVSLAIALVPAGFWPASQAANGVPDMQLAYVAVFGQGRWIILGSVVAFLLGQLLDVWVFHWVKQKTGEGGIWIRATGSTLVSQFLDSFVVLFIAFYWGADWPLSTVLGIGLINYAYKFLVALGLTPLIYLAHNRIERYLGPALADEMRREAMQGG